MHAKAPTGKQYHIACGRGDLTDYLLVPGDPDRVPGIARFWDAAREVSSNREFRSFSGSYKGVPVSTLSSGIGPAFMSIAVNEASSVGVSTFIRVGSHRRNTARRQLRRRNYFFRSCPLRLHQPFLHYA